MNCIEAHGISVELGGRRVLREVDFALRPGELVGLIGPNGSGKTTLLRTLCGLELPLTGQVSLAGEPISRLRPSVRSRRVGYLPQHAVFHWPLTVANAVALGCYASTTSVFGPSAADRTIIADALAATDLTAMATRPVNELSGGEAMRVHIARLLAGGHAALVADEPVTSLDPRYQLELLVILRRQAEAGVGVVLSLHDVPLAFRTCDRIVVMQDGAIVASGTPDAVFDDDTLERVFNIHFDRVETPAGITIVARGVRDKT
ncbi:MAG: ABC transporter ATP-binding protein [Gammaproteobacteria bacterium]